MQTFNYHSHTYRCHHADEDYTDEEYILDYIAAGFTEVAMTDHIPERKIVDFRKTIRMDYSQKEEYLASIRSLQAKYADKIKIVSGIEAEFCPGREDELLEWKEEVDLFVLGQHYVLRDGEDPCFFRRGTVREADVIRFAEYVERAIAMGLPDILAHPDVYLNNRQGEFTATDEKVAHRICRAAAEADLPVELNLHNIFVNTYRTDNILNEDPLDVQRGRLPAVSYPRREFWQIAREYPLRVIYGLDTHRRGEIQHFHDLITLAHEILGEETISKLHFIDHI